MAALCSERDSWLQRIGTQTRVRMYHTSLPCRMFDGISSSGVSEVGSAAARIKSAEISARASERSAKIAADASDRATRVTMDQVRAIRHQSVLTWRGNILLTVVTGIGACLGLYAAISNQNDKLKVITLESALTKREEEIRVIRECHDSKLCRGKLMFFGHEVIRSSLARKKDTEAREGDLDAKDVKFKP